MQANCIMYFETLESIPPFDETCPIAVALSTQKFVITFFVDPDPISIRHQQV